MRLEMTCLFVKSPGATSAASIEEYNDLLEQKISIILICMLLLVTCFPAYCLEKSIVLTR